MEPTQAERYCARVVYADRYAIFVNSSINYFLMAWANTRVGPVVR